MVAAGQMQHRFYADVVQERPSDTHGAGRFLRVLRVACRVPGDVTEEWFPLGHSLHSRKLENLNNRNVFVVTKTKEASRTKVHFTILGIRCTFRDHSPYNSCFI